MRIYNGENVAITVVTDGNSDVIIAAKSFADVETDASFNSDGFYIEEEGNFYAKENGSTGADLEIYDAK